MLAILLLLQSSSAGTVEGKGSPTADIPRLESSVRIDGVLDEPVWSRATRLTGFWQYQPVDGRPAEERTEVLVWYAPDAIHFGIVAYDRVPAAIHATVADRDNIDSEDQVVLDLDTFHDRRRAFFFGVNPLGVQSDGVRSEGAGQVSSLVPGSTDKNPDFVWESKGRITGRGYEIEIRIPFKSLRYPGGKRQTWGFNVTRIVQRTGYTDTWTDVRRANASFIGQEGAIAGLHDIRHGVTVEAQPFVTATANGGRGPAGGEFDREDVNPDAGLNLRLGFTSYALDATLNPDFSQVESDEGQVTVNERFALFFPEKRPFFLEGIELFGTPQTLVYTRRIVNPKAGAKLTGKFGQLGVAHLTAVDETADGDAWFNATRLRRDFGRNSIAGVTFTNRDRGGAHNRVLAGDFRYVWGLYYTQFQYGASWTAADGATRRAPIWQAEYDRTGRTWGFNYLLRGLGDGFEAQAGFVNRLRSGVVNGHAFNRLTLYGARGALLENLTVFFGPDRTWLYDDFGFKEGLEGFESFDATFQLRGGWELNGHLQRDFVTFQGTSFAGYTAVGAAGMAYLPPDDFSGVNWTAKVTTPTWRRLGAEVSYQRGRIPIFQEGATGTVRLLTGRVELRPAPTVRIAASGTAFHLFRLDGSEFARSLIPRLQAEYQPNRALFFRAIGEYRSERRAALRAARSGEPLFIDGAAQPALRNNGLRVDLLASFEPTPGTVAFLGYGSSLETDGDFNWSRLERVSDGFFVKLAYRVRR
ncbi:MAG: carbohydrate binding family 9 domain-containing protein [Gemmatimonadales bacterium]|nr:carbohydrate binding family 9 domain-containing protein [Gemmatimonadales bacterium]